MRFEQIIRSLFRLAIKSDEVRHCGPSIGNLGRDGGCRGIGGEGSILAAPRCCAVSISQAALVLICARPSVNMSNGMRCGSSRRVALYPGDEVDLEGGVDFAVHLVQDIGQLEDKLVILDIQSFIRLGISHADWEAHRPGISSAPLLSLPLFLVLIVFGAGPVQIGGSKSTDASAK